MMMRWALGVTLKQDKNRYIWWTAGVRRMGEKLRGERLRWYEHVRRRKKEYVGRKILEMEVPGKRKRGRPRRRWTDNIREDMDRVGVKDEDMGDREGWRTATRCLTLNRDKASRKRRRVARMAQVKRVFSHFFILPMSSSPARSLQYLCAAQ